MIDIRDASIPFPTDRNRHAMHVGAAVEKPYHRGGRLRATVGAIDGRGHFVEVADGRCSGLLVASEWELVTEPTSDMIPFTRLVLPVDRNGKVIHVGRIARRADGSGEESCRQVLAIVSREEFVGCPPGSETRAHVCRADEYELIERHYSMGTTRPVPSSTSTL